MIEYLYQEGVPPCEKEPLKVRRDGRVIGAIHKVEGGYQFIHEGKGADNASSALPTIDDVQKSLRNSL